MNVKDGQEGAVWRHNTALGKTVCRQVGTHNGGTQGSSHLAAHVTQAGSDSFCTHAVLPFAIIHCGGSQHCILAVGKDLTTHQNEEEHHDDQHRRTSSAQRNYNEAGHQHEATKTV